MSASYTKTRPFLKIVPIVKDKWNIVIDSHFLCLSRQDIKSPKREFHSKYFYKESSCNSNIPTEVLYAERLKNMITNIPLGDMKKLYDRDFCN